MAEPLQEDWDLLVSFLPGNWEELARSTGALRKLRKDKSPGNLLRTLLLHFGCGHSLRENRGACATCATGRPVGRGAYSCAT